MMTSTYILLVAGLVAACHGSYDDYRAWLSKAANNVTLQRDFSKHLHLFRDDNQHYASPPFPCNPAPRSDVTPTSVHRLRPADIQVVAALGDSITAGTGITACTIVGLLWQDRGLSWSIGGDGDFSYQPTIPNILRKFNPNLKGFSLKSGSVKSKNAHLDLAVPGAKSEDMVEQAESLIERLKSEPGVDFKNDWKLITIFIGGNDLCDYCDDEGRYNSSNYVQRIQKALDILHARIPRAFVNLVEVNHVDEMKKLNVGLVCSVAHLFICRCGAYPGSDEASQQLHQATDDYDIGLEKLVKSGRYDDREDFTVVLQPFFRDTKLPLKDGKPDLTFFSPDCFHFSRRAHSAAAIALWNNMIQPVGEKRTSWSPGQSPDCPTEDNPYLFTNKNSRR